MKKHQIYWPFVIFMIVTGILLFYLLYFLKDCTVTAQGLLHQSASSKNTWGSSSFYSWETVAGLGAVCVVLFWLVYQMVRPVRAVAATVIKKRENSYISFASASALSPYKKVTGARCSVDVILEKHGKMKTYICNGTDVYEKLKENKKVILLLQGNVLVGIRLRKKKQEE